MKKYSSFFEATSLDVYFKICEKIKKYKNVSPLYRCLPVLLTTFDEKFNIDEIIDSLPFSNKLFDITDFFNTLVNFGYFGQRINGKKQMLEAKQYPYLIIERVKGDIAPKVIMEESRPGTFIVYNPETLSFSEESISKFGNKIFSFSKIEVEDDPFQGLNAQKEANPITWFLGLLLRFRPQLFQVFITGLIINIVGLISPFFVMTVYDKIIGGKDLKSLPVIFGIAILFIFLDIIMRKLRRSLIGTISSRLDYLINWAIFKKSLFISPMQWEGLSNSMNLSRLKMFEPVRNFIGSPMITSLLDSPYLLLYIAVVGFFSPLLLIIPFFSFVIYAITGVVFVQLIKIQKEKTSSSDSSKQELLIETVDKLGNLKKLTQFDYWIKRFEKKSKKDSIETINYLNLISKMEDFSYFITMLAGTGTIITGVFLVWAQSITIGELVATMMIIWRIFSPLQIICLASARYKQIYNSILNITKFLSMESEKEVRKKDLLKFKLTGDVEFDNVGLKFSNDQGALINGFNLKIDQATFVTISGAAGTGRHTLLKLISGLYIPNMGSIRINNHDIRQISPQYLRKNISFVDRDPILIEGNVLDNLIVANYSASKDLIMKALKAAMLLEEVRKLPDRQFFRITPGKHNLSTEFLYKLSLARAFLRDPVITLLGEIPNSITNSTYWETFLSNIQEKMNGKTYFLITRNRKVIKESDILIFNAGGGKIYASSPDKLMDALSKANIELI